MQIALKDLIDNRIQEDPGLERHFGRAMAVTGQRAIRFPAPGEDSATMAAEAAYGLLANNSGKALAGLRYLAVGTETGLDHSKPLSAYVQGMLQQSGLPVPSSLASFQVQHACAGGTLGMMSIAGMLAASGRDETGLVIATDVARYTLKSTAELTQGAGAAAVLIEKDPRLLELELETVGFCSNDVDDFFRPLGSVTAKVKGSYSMNCYHQSLEEALQDHAQRSGCSPAQILEGSDFVVLHTPFRNMPEMAMKKLLATHLHKDEAAAIAWLEERGFYRGLEPIADIGNSYSASMFIFLMATLKDRYQKLGDAIVGKKFLLASYGSGSIMVVMRATVCPEAPRILDTWKREELPGAGIPASLEQYEHWTRGSGHGYGEKVTASEATSRFRLTGIREDGYREYEHERSGDDGTAENEASRTVHQPGSVQRRG
jgi:hydroxymethylglutaryl-CoA synthase